ncbi:hypothetical protein V6N12_032038 [Hibiscus sabdariffa]|uniref:Uncharacterized protein n=1 Tax=Hibiscus sabdariffa TaxID=183260 RepID=A0ABR2BYX5_9ROSI
MLRSPTASKSDFDGGSKGEGLVQGGSVVGEEDGGENGERQSRLEDRAKVKAVRFWSFRGFGEVPLTRWRLSGRVGVVVKLQTVGAQFQE